MGQAAYGISAETYSDLKALYNAHIVDTCIVMHGGGAAPPTQFPIDAKAAGTSRLANNGNDGVGGWDGSASYYPNMAKLGYVGCGGESEQGNEIDAIMANMTFIDMGGEGTAGGTNDDVWAVTHPGNASGHGACGRYETYDNSSNFWGWNVIGNSLLDCQRHKVKEVGILIGNWMLWHLAQTEYEALSTEEKTATSLEAMYRGKLGAVDEYIQLAHDMEANGIPFGGMWVWAGYGSNMNSLYQQFASWYQSFMAVWPADMRTMDVRYGATPPSALIQFNTVPTKAPDGSFVALGSDRATWRSTDGGKTWASLGGSCLYDLAVDSAHVFVVGTSYNLYYRLVNASDTWHNLGGICKSAPKLTGTGFVQVVGSDGAIWQRTMTTGWIQAYPKIQEGE